MRPNPALHAEIERLAQLKAQLPTVKELAEKYGVHEASVRRLIFAAVKRHSTARIAHSTSSELMR
jgi:DNA-binding transcriptional regulator YhcF (GntR family)